MFKKHHHDESHNMKVLALSSLHPHMMWIIEHCCVEMKACRQNVRPELCCHHNEWDIVLHHADATQMGKCCDSLEHLITLQAPEEFKRGI